MFIGIDLSLRSTGIASLDSDYFLHDFHVVHSSKHGTRKTKGLDDEELLLYNSKEIISYIEKINSENVIDGLCIEGLSFAGKSGKKDLIHGNFWYVRTQIRKKYPKMLIGIIPVKTWRKVVLNKEETEIAKEQYGKMALKQGVVDKLPEEVFERFNKYVIDNKLKKDSIFDLADAYFLTRYRIGLE